MADATIDLLKNSSYVGKMDELIAAVKLGGGATSDVKWDNVLDKPTTIAGYGITDAKIENGTITLGNQTITPLTSAPVTSVNSKTGAVTLSATDVSAIPSTLTGTAGQVLTKTADGQEWKDVNIPAKLPNPNALTFTGAVSGSYDGSAPLSVEIPSGGGGSSGFRLVRDLTLTESAESVIINSDDDGNPFSLSECFIQIFAKVTEVGKITYIPNQYYVAGTYFSSTTTTAKDYSYDFSAYSVGSEEMFFGYETKTRGAAPQAFYNVERNNNASPYRQKITSYRIDAKFDAGARFLLYGRDA